MRKVPQTVQYQFNTNFSNFPQVYIITQNQALKQIVKLQQMQSIQSDNYIGIWQLIPRNAFLYFPQGQEIRVGKGDKQWRKIFEGGQKYDEFEEDALSKLEEKLVLSKIECHPWFDRANKLRYLQANKWKKTPTCEAIAEYSRYRASQFPLKQNHQVLRLLSTGTFYICGRDHQYRPIIVVDFTRLNEKDADLVVPALVYLMQFIINQLLIEGQVQNYVMVMNLSSAGMGQKDMIMKIVSFTSKSYRGRLFVSYLLGTPWIIRGAWNGIAANFVSENTLKKLKMTGSMTMDEMWTHMDKEIIEKKYGGTALEMKQFWPVNPQKLLHQSSSHKNKLISTEEYNQKFSNMQLEKRKVLKSLLRRKTVTIRDLNKSQIKEEEINPVIESQKVLDRIDRSSLTDATILIESTIFPEDLKSIHTFFKDQKYLKIA